MSLNLYSHETRLIVSFLCTFIKQRCVQLLYMPSRRSYQRSEQQRSSNFQSSLFVSPLGGQNRLVIFSPVVFSTKQHLDAFSSFRSIVVIASRSRLRIAKRTYSIDSLRCLKKRSKTESKIIKERRRLGRLDGVKDRREGISKRIKLK